MRPLAVPERAPPRTTVRLETHSEQPEDGSPLGEEEAGRLENSQPFGEEDGAGTADGVGVRDAREVELTGGDEGDRRASFGTVMMADLPDGVVGKEKSKRRGSLSPRAVLMTSADTTFELREAWVISAYHVRSAHVRRGRALPGFASLASHHVPFASSIDKCWRSAPRPDSCHRSSCRCPCPSFSTSGACSRRGRWVNDIGRPALAVQCARLQHSSGTPPPLLASLAPLSKPFSAALARARSALRVSTVKITPL